MFAVLWDLTYYLFLRVLDGWPTGLLDRDVFFLIPVTWVGPVATAVVASSVVLVVSSCVYLAGGRGWRDPEPPRGGDRVRRADRDAIESSGRVKTSGA